MSRVDQGLLTLGFFIVVYFTTVVALGIHETDQICKEYINAT